MDIKLTPITLFIATILATTGCSADNQDVSNSEPCRNESSVCNEDKHNSDESQALPSTDEAWMAGKLAEIKAWLQEEKGPSKTATTPPQGISVRSPSATDPELMRIEAMSHAQNHRAAMSAINSFLAAHPASLEGKLTKSLVLNNMGKLKEAEALLKNTIARYPSSPEVYNNLAVLYAGQEDYALAIETLLKAFSTHPTYAQVHQNLRELYATLASQAYNRALDLNETSSTPQLVMLRRTSGNNAPALNYQPSAIVANDGLVETAKPATQITTAAPKEPVVAKVTETKIKAPIQSLHTLQLIDEAEDHIYRWAIAWSEKDVSQYLNTYTPDFRPLNGLSNSAWQTLRNQRLKKAVFIKVTVKNISTTIVNSNSAVVTFRQAYESDTFNDISEKQMLLTRLNKAWRIQEERSL
jgi:tetratricopeptide (TPR) repeat protein